MHSPVLRAPLLISLLNILPKLATAGLPPISGSGYNHVLFSDDFTGAAGQPPNPNKWMIDTGTQYPNGPSQWGTGEIETYTNNPANVKLSGKGNLQITPIKAADGSWTSGRIETIKDNFFPPAGGKMKVEANVRMPAVTPQNGLGYWPAFWMLGSGYRNPNQTWPVSLQQCCIFHRPTLSRTLLLFCGQSTQGQYTDLKTRMSANSTSWKTSTHSLAQATACTAALTRAAHAMSPMVSARPLLALRRIATGTSTRTHWSSIAPLTVQSR